MKTNQSEQAEGLEEAIDKYLEGVVSTPQERFMFNEGVLFGMKQSQPGIKQWVSEDVRRTFIDFIRQLKHLKHNESDQTISQSYYVSIQHIYQLLRLIEDLPNSTTTPKSDMVSKAEIVEVLKWACGYYDFPEKQPGQGNYYWRTHLREKMKEIGIEIPENKQPK